MAEQVGAFSVGDFVGPYFVGVLIQENETSLVYESFHPEKCEKLAFKLIKKSS
jgi:hypothetical protein